MHAPRLWSNRRLTFASPDLLDIDLHGGDLLTDVDIWAPRPLM